MNPQDPASRPVAAAADVTPAAVDDYRQRLSRGEDVIDPERWAGSLPAARGILARVHLETTRHLEERRRAVEQAFACDG